MDTKIDPKEEEKDKLFKEITEIKAKEWDVFIARLKHDTSVLPYLVSNGFRYFYTHEMCGNLISLCYF